mgnify:CR=1 FL=1|jgi:hypothetical protein|tara:strand:- start:364 stop:597 length:234 start_codon:yes stop_codon:yes gene_type:complete
MPGHTDKKKGNGKKKVLPVKPKPQRRSNGTAKKIQNITKKFEPQDVKLAKKIAKEPSFRKKLGNAILEGLTFGLYKP